MAVLTSLLAPLFLLAGNIQQVHSMSMWRLMLVSALMAFLLTFALDVYAMNYRKADIAAALIVAAWGFYGWIGLASIPVAILGIFFTLGDLPLPWKKIHTTLIIVLSVVAVSLSVGILRIAIQRDLHNSDTQQAAAPGPDVYFIVLDSYTGSQIIQDRFGVDNSAFLDGMRGLGFQVGDCTAPAGKTEASLSILLSGSSAEGDWDLIRHSTLRTSLEDRGYTTTAFSTGFVWTEITDADNFFWPNYGLGPTELETVALLQTPLRLLPLDLEALLGIRYRDRTQSLLVHLPDAAHTDGAQFVFAHILQPHPPFVFAADGSATSPGESINPDWLDDKHVPEYLTADFNAGYAAQVAYISAALLPILEEITTTAPDSIIILTGDHGAWYADEGDGLSVLCATYNLHALEARQAVLEIIGE
jgi:hypothetical protein